MTRYLLVANQTLGGAQLDAELRSRLDGSEGAAVHVVVPTIAAAKESGWSPGDAAFGIPGPGGAEDPEAVARRRSDHRLQAIIGRLDELGATATGEVGDSDPYEAVRSAVERHDVDEIIISTLPAGVSRWLKMDLASRVDRLVDCPVTTVEATD